MAADDIRPWTIIYPSTVRHLLDEVSQAEAERDPEKAHWLEVRIWRWVLEAIAQGRASDPAEVAKAVLETRSIVS